MKNSTARHNIAHTHTAALILTHFFFILIVRAVAARRCRITMRRRFRHMCATVVFK